MNEEAIKKLKNILEEATETEDSICYVTSDDADALKAAIQALEQMESSSEKPNKSEILTGWIPVSERLPKAGEHIGNVAKYYLVQNEYGDMMIARFTHSEYWEQIYQLKPIADKIIAWMPLPEPYRK